MVKLMKEANADPTLTWGSVAEKKLKGKVISEVRYMTAEEVEHIGWDSKGLIMVLTNCWYGQVETTKAMAPALYSLVLTTFPLFQLSRIGND